MKPLNVSKIRVSNAALLFPVRSTFVAPIFPEPISERFPNLNSFENINPKVTDPIKQLAKEIKTIHGNAWQKPGAAAPILIKSGNINSIPQILAFHQ